MSKVTKIITVKYTFADIVELIEKDCNLKLTLSNLEIEETGDVDRGTYNQVLKYIEFTGEEFGIKIKTTK